jgi:hypothetical protein
MNWKQRKLFQITCDQCGCPGPSSPGRALAAQEALVVGWVAVGDPLSPKTQWYCPDHKPADDTLSCAPCAHCAAEEASQEPR